MLTPKQEKFCLAYLETGNASEAYRRAYNASLKWKPASVSRKAKAMLDDAKIMARIAELRRPAQEAAQLTLATHLRDLERLRDLAMADDKWGPAVQAEIARGKASGLYVDKLDVSFSNTLAERLARARQR